jgi:hypothetical protein
MNASKISIKEAAMEKLNPFLKLFDTVIDTTDKLREPKGSAPRNVAIIAMMKY